MSKESLKTVIDIRNHIDAKGEFDEDVKALDWVVGRVQELEEKKDEFKRWWQDEARYNNKLIDQNKRYRDFIKLVSDPWEVARKVTEMTGNKQASAEEIVAWIEIESEKLLEESE